MGSESQSVAGERWPASVLPDLSNLLASLRHTLDRLDQAIIRLSGVAARLAHEFRTPLTVLRGEAEVTLSQTRSAEEYRQVLVSSLEEYVNLSRLIDDLLVLTPGESSEMLMDGGSSPVGVRRRRRPRTRTQ